MYRLQLTATTHAGVALTRDRGPGDTNHTLEYVPGSAIRGALAAQYLAAGGQPIDECFVRTFVQEEVSFPNLYPVKPEDRQGAALAVPLTARSCKYWSGFLGREEDASEEMHGVKDALLSTAVYQQGGGVHAVGHLDTCDQQGCRQPLERFRGFTFREDSGLYRRREVRTRLMARVAIDRLRRAAAEGLLYSIEAIAEGQWFCGELRCDDQVLLQEVRSRCLQAGKLRIGVAKTRGLGSLEYEVTEAASALPALTERLAGLDQAFRALAVGKDLELAASLYFAITLDADCLLTDAFLRYYRALPAETVAQVLELPTDAVQRLAYAAETRVVRGWNAALGMPKGDAVAMAMGSSFLFAYRGPLSHAHMAAKLERLEEHGLGIRQGEGFGRIIVSHPFHWEAATTSI